MNDILAQSDYNQTAYETAILSFLKQHQEGVTLADVVVGTGLNTEWVSYTLRQLLGKYPAYLEINAHKELVYLFNLTPKPLPIGKYIWQGVNWVMGVIWQVFTFAFKVWIVGMLFTYALAYLLILMLGIAIATQSGDMLKFIFEMLWGIVSELWDMLTGKKKSNLQGDKQTLNEVFSYVFGAKPPQKDERATEKIILQQL